MDLRAELTREGLVVVIRCPEAGVAEAIGRTVVEAGVRVLEVTLTTPDALEAVAALRRIVPDAIVGAGTVLTADDVEAAVAAGARFLVTPSWCEAVPAGIAAGVPVLAGAWSPSEVYQAHAAGAAAIKIFPASSGGPAHLRAIKDPFPQIPLVAVGGVGLNDVASYLSAGAVAVGVGGPLVGDAATGGSLSDLAERAARFVSACRRG